MTDIREALRAFTGRSAIRFLQDVHTVLYTGELSYAYEMDLTGLFLASDDWRLCSHLATVYRSLLDLDDIELELEEDNWKRALLEEDTTVAVA
jgi:hypothetical protein